MRITAIVRAWISIVTRKSVWSRTLPFLADVPDGACVPVVARSRIKGVGTAVLRGASVVGTHVAVVAVGLYRARVAASVRTDVSQRAGISVFARELIGGGGASCSRIAAIVSAWVVVIAREGRCCLAHSVRATFIC